MNLDLQRVTVTQKELYVFPKNVQNGTLQMLEISTIPKVKFTIRQLTILQTKDKLFWKLFEC